MAFQKTTKYTHQLPDMHINAYDVIHKLDCTLPNLRQGIRYGFTFALLNWYTILKSGSLLTP